MIRPFTPFWLFLTFSYTFFYHDVNMYSTMPLIFIEIVFFTFLAKFNDVFVVKISL